MRSKSILMNRGNNMKRLIFAIALLCLSSFVLYAQEKITIEYTDLDGNIRQVPALGGNRIVIFRPDGSAEVDLAYNSGLLKQITVRRENGSVEADVLYSSSRNLQSITARRANGSAEAHVVYQDAILSDVASFRADGTLEAIIGYKDGILEHLSVANIEQEQIEDEERRVIEFFPVAQLLVQNEVVVCAQK